MTTPASAIQRERRGDRRRFVIGAVAILALVSGLILFWAALSGRGMSREERLQAHTLRPRRGQVPVPGEERPRFGPGGIPPMMGAADNPLTRELNLSAEQQKRLDALREQNGAQMRAAMEAIAAPNLTDEQRRAKMAEVHNGMREQMRQVLTPEQQTKFDAQAAQMEQRMRERRAQMRSRMSELRERMQANGQEVPKLPGGGGFPGGGMPMPPPPGI